jgi:hypothetical protein
MKRFDPAETFDEPHYRANEVKDFLHIGYSTALELIKKHPKVKYLPVVDRLKRTRRTPMLPESALKEMYVNDLVE